MRRLAEITAFLGLSAAVHAGILAGFGESFGGPQGQGAGGTDRITLQAAPESLAAVADHWTTPPDVMATPSALTSPVPSDSLPDVSAENAPGRAARPSAPHVVLTEPAPLVSTPAPALSRPILAPSPSAPSVPPTDLALVSTLSSDAPPLLRAPPHLTAPEPLEAVDVAAPDTTLPPPPGSTRLAAATSPRPPARPFEPPPPRAATAPQTAPPSTPQPARVAEGAGAGATQGTATAPSPPSLSAAQQQSLMARWGAQIMARIERNRPRVRGTGQVTLALQVARNGQLAGLSVAQSSGDPALDDAALSAVRRAGGFPHAPDGLTEASYAFSLPIRFR